MINPTPAKIEDILNSSVQFVVPRYQREYTWTKEEALEFFEDLEEYLDSSTASLFLGTLIFDISEIAEKKIKVVDGQQRLTTILLLLIACREAAKKIKAIKLAPLIQNKITFTDPSTAESLGSRLIASESVKETFEELSKYEWKGNFTTRLNGIDGRRLRGQVNRLKPIYEYFAERLQTYDQTKLSKFLRVVYGTYIVRIDIENESEAFHIFERTNARGVDLEASDLLKNNLFAQGVDGLEEAWKQIIENSDGTLLRMLKYFYVAKLGYIAKSKLYTGLKNYGREIGAAQMVSELDGFSKFYHTIRTANVSETRNYFKMIGCSAIAADQDKYEKVFNSFEALRLFKVSQVYPLIYAAIFCFVRSGEGKSGAASKRLIQLLELLEKYHFINNAVCQHIGNEVEKLYAMFCEKYSHSRSFDKITNELIRALKAKLASEDEFISHFTEISYSGESIPLVSYIFDRINNTGLHPGHRVRIFNSDQKILRKNHNIEHFYPQTPSVEMVADPLTLDAADNVGNLLAISFRTNSKLGNLSPKEKIEKLQGNLKREIQNLPYVQEFIKTYGKAAASWDSKAIDKRSKALAKQAYREVWKVS